MLSGRKNKYRPRRLFLKDLQPGKGGYTYEFISAYSAQSSLPVLEAKSESYHKNTGKGTEAKENQWTGGKPENWLQLVVKPETVRHQN